MYTKTSFFETRLIFRRVLVKEPRPSEKHFSGNVLDLYRRTRLYININIQTGLIFSVQSGNPTNQKRVEGEGVNLLCQRGPSENIRCYLTPPLSKLTFPITSSPKRGDSCYDVFQTRAAIERLYVSPIRFLFCLLTEILSPCVSQHFSIDIYIPWP